MLNNSLCDGEMSNNCMCPENCKQFGIAMVNTNIYYILKPSQEVGKL